MEEVGKRILKDHSKPKAILSISAHWFTRGTFIQSDPNPRQIYDMYGFPEALYEVKYPVKGNRELTERVKDLLKDKVSVNDSWGIDHGTWTVLVHMFPKADIPVVQLSVDTTLSEEECYALGKKLSALREEGFLIFASGNVVHNLGRVEWDNPDGTKMTHSFNDTIVKAIEEGKDEDVIHYASHPYASYAVPTREHYLPLIYSLGAADKDKATVFNNICNLGSIAMTGFVFGE